MALNSLSCADVPLSKYSLTHPYGAVSCTYTIAPRVAYQSGILWLRLESLSHLCKDDCFIENNKKHQPVALIIHVTYDDNFFSACSR